MQVLIDMLRDGGIATWMVLIAGGLALGAGTVTAIMLWLRRRVPVAIALVPFGGVVVVAVLGHIVAAAASGRAIATAPPEMMQTLLARGLSEGMYTSLAAGLWVTVVAIPICWLAAGAALKQENRSWAWGGIAAAVVLVCAALPLFGLGMNASPTASVLRAAVALFLGLPTAFALTGGDWHGRLAGVLATGAFAMAIIGAATAEVAMGSVEVFRAVATAAPESRQLLFDDGLGIVETIRNVAFFPAVAAVLLATFATSRVKEDRDRPGATAGLAAVGLGLLLLVMDATSLAHGMGF